MNQMRGIRALAEVLHSGVEILDVDLDGRFDFTRRYGLALFLGTLYHLKNPFYCLEMLAKHARYCILSTRVTRLSADRTVRLDNLPVAYLLDSADCNSDATNYWIFSPLGLQLLVKRTDWQVCGAVSSGLSDSDPVGDHQDERFFLLLRSGYLP